VPEKAATFAMLPEVQKRVREISLDKSATLLSALELMDRTSARLLLVMNGDAFLSLLSIGDIQRAIVRQIPLNSPVDGILRQNIRVARDHEPAEVVRQRMLEHRTECMPVLDGQGRLVNVFFWDALIHGLPRGKLSTPVVIMAGGEGARMRPLTNIIPKPLIPVGDKPLLEEITDRFHSCGVQDFYISLNYKADMVERYFAEHPKPYQLHYFREDRPLGTAGSLRLLRGLLTETFFVSNCDILVEHDFAEIHRAHVENRHELTAVAALKVQSVPYGIFHCDEQGLLREIHEKPTLPFLVNVGLYILEPHLLDEIPEDRPYHVTHLMEAVRQRGGRVGVFPIHEGDWVDIGEWSEYFGAIARHRSRRSQERNPGTAYPHP
jgi:dTDP-glucose pyrophosphorylase